MKKEKLTAQLRNFLVPQASSDARTASPMAELDRATRVALWAVVIGFGGFLGWAAWAPLDEGVPCQAVVSIDTKRKALQHLSGGIVREVLVKEGQRVAANAVLMRLDPASTLANYETVRQHYLGLRAMEGRLEAEQLERSSVTFHADVLKAADDPGIKAQIAHQEQLFRASKGAIQAEIQAIEQNIQGDLALLAGYHEVLASRRGQLASLQQELDGMRDLVKEGYAPRNKQLELERALADTDAAIAEVQGNIARTQRTVTELKLRAIQRHEEFRRDVDNQLAEIRRELQGDSEKLGAATGEMNRTEIRAPVAGQVVGLVVQSIGAVIQPGQKVMDIVPGDEALVLEARIAPYLIDRVHAGLGTDVRFSAFAHTPQLVVPGTVSSVSGDVVLDTQNNQSYYLARIALTPEGMARLGDQQRLQPGMPAEVVIKTGERSLLTYLLYPLVRRLGSAMKEE